MKNSNTIQSLFYFLLLRLLWNLIHTLFTTFTVAEDWKKTWASSDTNSMAGHGWTTMWTAIFWIGAKKKWSSVLSVASPKITLIFIESRENGKKKKKTWTTCSTKNPLNGLLVFALWFSIYSPAIFFSSFVQHYKIQIYSSKSFDLRRQLSKSMHELKWARLCESQSHHLIFDIYDKNGILTA